MKFGELGDKLKSELNEKPQLGKNQQPNDDKNPIGRLIQITNEIKNWIRFFGIMSLIGMFLAFIWGFRLVQSYLP